MPCRIRSMSPSSRWRMDAWKRRWIASGRFVAMGLWPKRCVAGTVRRDFAGWEPAGGLWPPAALSQDRCVALAGLGAVRPPRCGLPSVGHVPVAGGESVYGQSALRLPEGRPGFALARMSPRRRPPSPPARFRVTCTCRVVTRRSRVRVPRFRRRCAVPLVRARTGRSNGAAQVERSWWREGLSANPAAFGNACGVVRAETARTPGSARPRYVGRCGAPSHSGGARHAVESASLESVEGAVVDAAASPNEHAVSRPNRLPRDSARRWRTRE